MATHSSILAWRIPMNRGAWRATVHGVAKSRARLSDCTHESSWEQEAVRTDSWKEVMPGLGPLQPGKEKRWCPWRQKAGGVKLWALAEELHSRCAHSIHRIRWKTSIIPKWPMVQFWFVLFFFFWGGVTILLGHMVGSVAPKLVSRPHQSSHFSELSHTQYHPLDDFKTVFFMKIDLKSAGSRKDSGVLSGSPQKRAVWDKPDSLHQVHRWPGLLSWVLLVYQCFFKLFVSVILCALVLSLFYSWRNTEVEQLA